MADDVPLRHIPVLGETAVEWLVWRTDGTYIDATLGAGGHSESICRTLTGHGRLVAIDRDPVAHRLAEERLGPWRDRVEQRLARFGRLGENLDEAGTSRVSGALFDLGVSSVQLDTPERGFSFRFDSPLDMRMGPDAPHNAKDIVNQWSPEELRRIFRDYGEEPRARRIANAIARERAKRPIETTGRLADIVKDAGHGKPEKVLARVFQAVRIAANQEMDELREGLGQAVERLEPGGRLVAIAYHSIEDRVVKMFISEQAADCVCPPDLPVCRCDHRAVLRSLTRHVIKPSPEEIASNPRARSARMRVAERLGDA